MLSINIYLKFALIAVGLIGGNSTLGYAGCVVWYLVRVVGYWPAAVLYFSGHRSVGGSDDAERGF